MIYITGDTHANFKYRFNRECFPEQKHMTKEDYVIICGDFGGIWNKDRESKEEKYWLDWFESRNFTLLFVCGNHENFDRLYKYPVREWNGGNVHVIRPHVLHLMRGQVFALQGKTFFTFGGARSHDISGGILDPEDPDFKQKKKRLSKGWEPFRINHVSWWKEEMPSAEEMEKGRMNLSIHNNNVDYIVSHCASTSSQMEFGEPGAYEADQLTDYFEWVKQNVSYRKWFYGHYHDNRNVNKSEITIYEQIVRIL